MKRFCAQMNDGSFINVPADRMEKVDNAIYAYDGPELVAFVDTSGLIHARVGEDGRKDNDR